MTTNWKALCAELAENVRYLLDCVADDDSDPVAIMECVQHLGATRDALAQSEPEGPTVMEIIALADEIEAEKLGQVDLVRRALARWGRPAIQPETNGQT